MLPATGKENVVRVGGASDPKAERPNVITIARMANQTEVLRIVFMAVRSGLNE
jgi:hypothetical protein